MRLRTVLTAPRFPIPGGLLGHSKLLGYNLGLATVKTPQIGRKAPLHRPEGVVVEKLASEEQKGVPNRGDRFGIRLTQGLMAHRSG